MLNTQLYALIAARGMSQINWNTWRHVICAMHDVAQYFARDYVIYYELGLTCGTAHARACT
jgi:hypothetical protein